MVGVQAWVEDTLQKIVHEMAVKDDITVSSWIRRAIREKIERDSKTPAKRISEENTLRQGK